VLLAPRIQSTPRAKSRYISVCLRAISPQP
jgi:hypothetical protein